MGSLVERSWVRTSIGAVFAVAISLSAAGGYGQQADGPFAGLAGTWSGTGTVSLASGGHERIRCRANYVVQSGGYQIQQSLRCASDSYTFDLSSNVKSQGSAVAGTWSEKSRSISGNLTGSAKDGYIQVLVESSGFSAVLSMTTRGDRQSVTIESKGKELTGVSITLSRRG